MIKHKNISPLIFTVAILALVGMSCGKSSDIKGPYTAELLNLIPKQIGQHSSEEPQYEIKKVTFKYLEDLETLSSRYYNFFSGGTLEVLLNGVIKPRFNEIEISKPALHYSVKDNVIIPKDNYTLFILSTAYQLDFILSEIQKISGINPDEILNAKGKFKIYFNTSLAETTPVQTKTLDTGNAAYIPSFFSFITLKTSNAEKVPLSVNLNVMAHEFGHLMFNYLTTNFEDHPHLEEASQYTDIVGFNEGFADLISYTLTGNSNALSGSFELKEGKDAEVLSQRDFSKVDFNEQTLSFCQHGFYCIGTLFNHAFYQTQVDLGLDPTHIEDRIASFKLIVDALKEVGAEVKLNGLNQSSAFRDFIHILLLKIKDPQFSKTLNQNLKKKFPLTLR